MSPTHDACCWGNALERANAAVLDDVLGEYLLFDAAVQAYSVVIDRTTLTVDQTATDRRRCKMRARPVSGTARE